MVDLILTHCHLEQQTDFFWTKTELHDEKKSYQGLTIFVGGKKKINLLLALGLSVGFVLMLVSFLFCGYAKIL